jgi:hypothetical protein
MREVSLGFEAMTRLVKGQPLRQVHECVLGLLALESDRSIQDLSIQRLHYDCASHFVRMDSLAMERGL